MISHPHGANWPSWSMGLLNPSDWHAKWIGREEPPNIEFLDGHQLDLVSRRQADRSSSYPVKYIFAKHLTSLLIARFARQRCESQQMIDARFT